MTLRGLLRSLLCKHEYRLLFFGTGEVRMVLNLTCVHCGQERIELLARDWDRAVYGATKP